MINLLFSMNGPRLIDEQASVFTRFGQWVVLNERDNRLLVDAVGEYADINDAMQALSASGRNPVPIGGWKKNGEPLAHYPLNLTAWLAVAPDEWDTTDPENPTASRPTEWKEVHRWGGWEEKT